MKRLLLILLMMVSIAYGQSVGQLRYDTVKIYKVGGNGELVIENGTRAVIGGVLTNLGNGRTSFVMPSGGGGSTDTANHWLNKVAFNGAGDSLIYYINTTRIAIAHPGGTGTWGSITGTLSSQTDLQTALNLKVNISDTSSMLTNYVRKSRLLNTGFGLTGGGNLTADRTFVVDTATLFPLARATITASNGVTKENGVFKLGGTFTGNRSILLDTFRLILNSNFANQFISIRNADGATHGPEISFIGGGGGSIKHDLLTSAIGSGSVFPGQAFYVDGVIALQNGIHYEGAGGGDKHYDIFDLRSPLTYAAMQFTGVSNSVWNSNGVVAINYTGIKRTIFGSSQTANNIYGTVHVAGSTYLGDSLMINGVLTGGSGDSLLVMSSSKVVKKVAQSSISGASLTLQQVITNSPILTASNNTITGSGSFVNNVSFTNFDNFSTNAGTSFFESADSTTYTAGSGHKFYGPVRVNPAGAAFSNLNLFDVNGSVGFGIASTATNLTLDTYYHTIKVDASGGARVITLPPAANYAHTIYVVLKTDASANTVTIDGNASETIDGATTKVITAQYSGYMIQCDGTSWFTISTQATSGAATWGSITGTLSSQTDLQTALNLKANLASPTFTGTVTIPTPFTLGAVSVLPTGTELNFVDGVTSAIQTQLDAKQPLDADLTTIAGLTATTDNFIQSKAGAWASRTIAQVKTDLGLTGTNSGDQTTIAGITGTTAQFNTALTDNDFATLAGTETLSAKTLTAPKFASGGFIADANGNELLIFTTTASAVNELTFANGATGVYPKFTASGSDANIGIELLAKGTGAYNLLGNATQAAELRLHEVTGDGTNFTAFKVGTQAVSITLTMPTAYATTNGYVLSSTTAGVLSWVAQTGGSSTGVIYYVDPLTEINDSTLGMASGDWGDITTSSGGDLWTIDNDVVTYAKMQNVSATSRFLGRITAAAGDAEELTGTQATTLLDVFTTSVKGLVPAATGGNTTTEFLRKDGSWQVPSGGGGSYTAGYGLTLTTTVFSLDTSIAVNKAGAQVILGSKNFTGLQGFNTGAPTHSATFGSTATGIALYGTTDQVTNYERLRIYWTASEFRILSEKGGTGTQRSIVLNGATTFFSNGNIDVGGHSLGNVTTISGSNGSPLNIATQTLSAASGVEYLGGITGVINQTSTAAFTAFLVSPFLQATGSGAKILFDVGTNTAAAFAGTHTSLVAINSAGVLSLSGAAAQAGEIRFLEDTDDGANYSSFKSVAQAANLVYTLPPAFVAGGALTDVAGNGVLTWVVPSGGSGANAALSNLASVAINTALLPGATGKDLGAAATPFRELYLHAAGTYGTGSLKFTGTPSAARTVNFPDASITVARIDAAQTFTGVQTFSSAPVIGSITNTGTLTLPTVTGTIAQYAEASTASSATPTPSGDARVNWLYVTAQAAAAAFGAPTGTAANGNQIVIRIKDNATARALTYNAIYRASSDLALPSTTIISKTLYLGFVYNSTDTKWDLVSVLNNF